MKSNPERSLKSLNLKWLIALAMADAILIILLFIPEASKELWNSALILRTLTTAILPVAVLLIVNVLPHDIKAMLVYWRRRGWLPGSEAFSKYGPADVRTDMAALKRHVGTLPTDPKEQNSKWYKLYKLVENQVEVSATQKDFLMYRDMAVLSLPLIFLVPPALFFAGVGTLGSSITAILFLSQYLLTAVSARNAGIRFVANVLAIHSTRKISAAKPAAVP